MTDQREFILLLLLFAIAWLLRKSIVMYPLILLVTLLHELGHALAVLIVGGRVKNIQVGLLAGGLTNGLIKEDTSRLSRICISSAGYLGSIFFGFTIFCLPYGRCHQYPLIIVGVLLLLITALWVRNVFGIVFSVALGVCLVLLGLQFSGTVEAFIAKFIGVSCVLQSFLTIDQDRLQVDLEKNKKITRTPIWAWKWLWRIVALAVLLLMFKIALSSAIL